METKTKIEELERELGRSLTDCERWHLEPSWFPGCCDDCHGCRFCEMDD